MSELTRYVFKDGYLTPIEPEREIPPIMKVYYISHEVNPKIQSLQAENEKLRERQELAERFLHLHNKLQDVKSRLKQQDNKGIFSVHEKIILEKQEQDAWNALQAHDKGE